MDFKNMILKYNRRKFKRP